MKKKRMLWIIPLLLLGIVVGGAIVYGQIVQAHFERGTQDINAVVLKVDLREVQSGLRRVGNHYVRTGRSRTERKIRYQYTVDGEVYTDSYTTSKPMPRSLRTGDSIRIRYATYKPSLSRVYH